MEIIKFNDLITGEKLQSLADFCFIDEFNPNRHQYSKKSFVIQNKNGPLKNFPKFMQNEIKKYKVIYIPTHFLEYFFANIFPHISKCILITHNSDNGILDHFSEETNKTIINTLNSNKIIHWYSQNISLNHPKLSALPIGIANSMWKHGDLKLLHSIMTLNIPKSNLYYFNFDVNTRKDRRQTIYNQCIRNGLKPSPKTNQKQYLLNLKKSKFCICPPGNGYDCHRLWEAIYLNCIPILINWPAYQQFKDLPILLVDNWMEVTPGFMDKKYDEFKNKKYNYDRAKFSYYKNIIN